MLHNRSPVHQPDDKLCDDDHADGRHRRDKLARLAVTLLLHSAAAVLRPASALLSVFLVLHRRFKEGLVPTALRLSL